MQILILLLLVKLVIHLHQLLLVVLLFFLIVSKAINDLLLLWIVHILDNSFRTKIGNDNSRLAEDSWKVTSLRHSDRLKGVQRLLTGQRAIGSCGADKQVKTNLLDRHFQTVCRTTLPLLFERRKVLIDTLSKL